MLSSTTLQLNLFFSDVLDKLDGDGETVGSSSGESAQEIFDCVICGQSSTSTEGSPVGLVVLLQPSSGEENTTGDCTVI